MTEEKRHPRWGKQPFVICYWDTFDNETFKVGHAKTLEIAEALVDAQYKGRIRADGADSVEIIDLRGHIVRKWNVG